MNEGTPTLPTLSGPTLRGRRTGWLALNRLASAIGLIALTAGARLATAYECQTNPGTQECAFWPDTAMPIPFSVNGSRSAELSEAQAISVAQGGMGKWPSACQGCVSIRYESSTTETAMEGDGSNEIEWVDSGWTDGKETIGITVIIYSTLTNEIVESDMRLNNLDYQWRQWTANQPNAGEWDVDALSIVTHEAGHFYGLDHSRDAESTMYAYYKPGSIDAASPACDDIEGICSIYTCADGVLTECRQGPPPAGDDDDTGQPPNGGNGGNGGVDCRANPEHPSCQSSNYSFEKKSGCGCRQLDGYSSDPTASLMILIAVGFFICLRPRLTS